METHYQLIQFPHFNLAWLVRYRADIYIYTFFTGTEKTRTQTSDLYAFWNISNDTALPNKTVLINTAPLVRNRPVPVVNLRFHYVHLFILYTRFIRAVYVVNTVLQFQTNFAMHKIL